MHLEINTRGRARTLERIFPRAWRTRTFLDYRLARYLTLVHLRYSSSVKIPDFLAAEESERLEAVFFLSFVLFLYIRYFVSLFIWYKGTCFSISPSYYKMKKKLSLYFSSGNKKLAINRLLKTSYGKGKEGLEPVFVPEKLIMERYKSLRVNFRNCFMTLPRWNTLWFFCPPKKADINNIITE